MFPGLSLLMWNLEPYVHNPMSIAEAYDRAEFVQMGINKESSETVRYERKRSRHTHMRRSWLGSE